jgi:hypothetical protein
MRHLLTRTAWRAPDHTGSHPKVPDTRVTGVRADYIITSPPSTASTWPVM